MSLNQLINPRKTLNINVNSVNCNTFKISGSEGVRGSVLMVGENGNLEFNTSTASSQRDLFLLNNTLTISNIGYPETSNLMFDTYRDGAFSLIQTPKLCKIEFSLSYYYLNSIGNLPFEIIVKNNDIEIYKKQYGQLDQYNQLNKIVDSFVRLLSNTTNLNYYIKKLYNDQGYIQIQPNISYISIEIL